MHPDALWPELVGEIADQRRKTAARASRTTARALAPSFLCGNPPPRALSLAFVDESPFERHQLA